MEYFNDKGKPVAQNYYEGVLQLRDVTKEVIKKTKEMIEYNDRVFIAKETKVKNGVDLFLSSQKLMQMIAKDLQRIFGGEVNITRKLYSVNRQTSKEIYRVTVLFRMFKFKVGDVVKAGAKLIRITRIDKKVHGIDTDSGKKISVSYDKVQS